MKRSYEAAGTAKLIDAESSVAGRPVSRRARGTVAPAARRERCPRSSSPGSTSATTRRGVGSTTRTCRGRARTRRCSAFSAWSTTRITCSSTSSSRHGTMPRRHGAAWSSLTSSIGSTTCTARTSSWMPTPDAVEIRRLSNADARAHLDGLAAILRDCVEGGASVSYMAPFSDEDARTAFEGFVADAERGGRLVLAAFENGEVVGTVQVLLALPPNQAHRGEIAKLLVRRSARRRGVARRLMEAAEDEARAE